MSVTAADAFSQLGVPDPAEAAVRILASRRLGPRKRAALVLILEGVGYRAAARAVGLADHMALHRAAHRLGLRQLHCERARFRGAMQKIAEAQTLLVHGRKERSTVHDALRALSLATDAAIALRSLRTY
jgi:hypothetical protein